MSSRCCAHSSLCSSRAAAAPPLELPPAASVEVEAAPSPSSSTVVVVVPLPPRRRISRISEILPFASTRILCTRCSYSTRFRFAGCFFLSSPRDSLLAATSGTGRPLSVGPSASSGASSSRTSTAANARSSGGGGASASGFGGGFGFGGAFGRAWARRAPRRRVLERARGTPTCGSSSARLRQRRRRRQRPLPAARRAPDPGSACQACASNSAPPYTRATTPRSGRAAPRPRPSSRRAPTRREISRAFGWAAYLRADSLTEACVYCVSTLPRAGCAPTSRGRLFEFFAAPLRKTAHRGSASPPHHHVPRPHAQAPPPLPERIHTTTHSTDQYGSPVPSTRASP